MISYWHFCIGWAMGAGLMWAFWENRIHQACSSKPDHKLTKGQLWLRMKFVDAITENLNLVNENPDEY